MKQKIKHFWTWFSQNQQHLKALRELSSERQKELLHQLEWNLHFYAPGIDYLLIFPERRQGKAELVITANGDPDYFPTVEEIVGQSPSLDGWTITAFVRPSADIDEMARGLDKPYVFQDIILKASELKFRPSAYDGEKIDMIVYLRNYTVRSRNTNLLQLIFIMMQDLLGEKSLHQNINFVELAQMPGHADPGIIHLYELQAYLDQLNRFGLRGNV